MTIDVVDASLRVVFLDEDRRRGPNRAVADGFDKAAKGQVVVGLHGDRLWRAASVVGADPHELQLGHRTGGDVILEILIPDIEAELVGDTQVELWVGLVGCVDQVRQWRVRGDRVDIIELGLVARLVTGEVVVEVDPQWFGSRPVGL
jgi:hypothetical protein